MDNKYIAGTFFASVFGSLVVYILRLRSSQLKSKQKAHANGPGFEIQSDQMAVDKCRSGKESDTDVIIVGAGVVGAALSHTLGKVESLSTCDLYLYACLL